MSGASRWLDAAAPCGRTAPTSAARTTATATAAPSPTSSTPLFMPISFPRLTEVGLVRSTRRSGSLRSGHGLGSGGDLDHHADDPARLVRGLPQGLAPERVPRRD